MQIRYKMTNNKAAKQSLALIPAGVRINKSSLGKWMNYEDQCVSRETVIALFRQ